MFNTESNAGDGEVREWFMAEYEAGYTARFAGAPESVIRQHIVGALGGWTQTWSCPR